MVSHSILYINKANFISAVKGCCFLSLVAREFAIATAFLAYFLGFEGITRLECDIS